ncbi:MAG: hypothetical protein HC849_13660 [Oscillatoriales cyanobacterium RU_3_3]|nr:hypothetical protein [Microcoleus sp. SU_5_6]NJL69807.1 hypothetical protein [Microcoleus sp. SM1_3_4]NJM61018.1 hypothetical protein [Oscillatoriales cyanobacterium RU_3_3]NJR24147.1 hypothetical protein [Richelia sp. CSU_2_1]
MPSKRLGYLDLCWIRWIYLLLCATLERSNRRGRRDRREREEKIQHFNATGFEARSTNLRFEIAVRSPDLRF